MIFSTLKKERLKVENGSSILGTEYEDFKIVNGTVFPLKLNNFAGEKNISLLTINRLTINQPLPEGVFSSGY